ncbi:cytochrome C [Geomonas azotofigens]|uniref:cytochrome C n=1 Tax=Geomonas azotofigens TaxID=2843196 RepID=UPI001C100145|nr:cytochrome C [Geomonas azotofigens]MBU5615378.1 cytochrome C [Geomonas azotofigens]
MKGRILVALAVTTLSFTTLHAAQEVPQFAPKSAPSSGTNLGSVTGGVFKEAHLVIDKKCVSCHTAQRIESAIAAGKDMQKIQHRMELKGAKLTADEQTVLGIFYKESPLKPKK